MDHQELSMIITMFEHSSLTELEISCQSYTLRLKRNGGSVPVPEAQPVREPVGMPAKSAAKSDTAFILSPIVGTFYRAPSPDSPPYVEVGDKVRKGEVVCTLEAMKLMNQLEAEYDCEIVAILAEQGAVIEFGQPLFEVRPV